MGEKKGKMLCCKIRNEKRKKTENKLKDIY